MQFLKFRNESITYKADAKKIRKKFTRKSAFWLPIRTMTEQLFKHQEMDFL